VTVRAAQSGDICLLLVPSRPPSPNVKALLDGLKDEFGGRIIEPLHVTIDRVAAADTDDLVRAVRECVPRLRKAAVRGRGLFVLRSEYRGADVLKLEVEGDEALDHDVDELRAALRQAGLHPMYGDERSMTVTALERIERSAAPNVTAVELPIDLFVGDTLLVSRIRGVGNYETLDTAMLQPSG
jgi:hypothetical protein